MSKRFLVLGCTGLLGQALMKELHHRSITAVGVARKNTDIKVDVTDEKALLSTIDDFQPDVIINTVAIVDHSFCENKPRLTKNVNAKPSIFLSEYASLKNIKYVYISTDHYYTGDRDKKHSELAPLNLSNQYAVSKQLGEEFTLSNNNSLVIRTNIVGFRSIKDRPTFVEWAINELSNNSPMQLFDDFYTSSIDVDSFSKSLLDLIEKNASGILNLASSQVSSKATFILALARRLSLATNNTKTVSMTKLDQIVDRNESLGLDVSKAEKILGYSLPRLDQVIENLATEYLKNE